MIQQLFLRNKIGIVLMRQPGTLMDIVQEILQKGRPVE